MTDICLTSPSTFPTFNIARDPKPSEKSKAGKATSHAAQEPASQEACENATLRCKSSYDNGTEIRIRNEISSGADSKKLFADGVEMIKQYFLRVGTAERERRMRELAEELGLQQKLPPVGALSLPRSASLLPSRPPALWLKDRLPGETPAEFIMRVYRPYIGKGLTRAFFLEPGQDVSLYTAIRKYLRKAETEGMKLPEGFSLPNRREIAGQRIEQLGVSSAPEAWRQAIEKASPEVRELLQARGVLSQRQARAKIRPSNVIR